jgi:uncharacterized membrane protein
MTPIWQDLPPKLLKFSVPDIAILFTSCNFQMNTRWTTAQILDFAGVISIISFWAYAYHIIKALPEVVPKQFNFAGEPDDFSSKNTSYFLPAVASVIFILLTVINRHPERFNYPFPINEHNAERQYRLAGNFIRTLRLSVVIIFLMIFYFVGQAARTGIPDFQKILLPAILLLTFLPIMVYLIMASAIKSS